MKSEHDVGRLLHLSTVDLIIHWSVRMNGDNGLVEVVLCTRWNMQKDALQRNVHADMCRYTDKQMHAYIPDGCCVI